MNRHSGVDSLLNSCMYAVVKHYSKQRYDLSAVPLNIKERLTRLLCKRGLVSDLNIASCIFSGIKEIDLSECDVTDKSLEIIAGTCSRLVKIDLNAAKGQREAISTAGVIALSVGCPTLRIVFLRRCINVHDEAIVAIACNCRKLEQLNVGGCLQITDCSLEGIAANCAHLSCLNVSGTSITDDGVRSLCDGMTQRTLVELHINSCLNLTDRAVDDVVQRCPFIRILLLHGCPKMTEATRAVIDELSSRMRQVTWTIY